MPIRFDVPMNEYLAMDALSSGVAWRAYSQSPLHAKCYRESQDNCSTADIGTVAHQILLEGHEDHIVVVEADDWRTKDAREQRDDARLECKVAILAEQMKSVRSMVEAARHYVEHSEIKGVFDKGHAEVTVDWNEGGVDCKARPDYLSEHFHISLKTTNASAYAPTWTRRQLGPNGYDFGLEFYRLGLLANGIDVRHRFLVIEQNPPFGCQVIELSRIRQEVNKEKVKRAIKLWGDCLNAQSFPGYARMTYEADMTPWEMNEAEDANLLSLYAS